MKFDENAINLINSLCKRYLNPALVIFNAEVTG